MIVLDASVLIGLLDGADAHHAAAVDLLEETVEQDLAVSVLTLAEVLVVPQRLGRVDEVLAAVRDLPVRELSLPPGSAAHLARLRVDTGLRLPDCCVLLGAETGDAAVASFDLRLRAAAAGRGLTVLGAAPG